MDNIIELLTKHYRDQSEFQIKEANKHSLELVRTLMYISTGTAALVFGSLYSGAAAFGMTFLFAGILLLFAIFFGGLQMWLNQIAYKEAGRRSSKIVDRTLTYIHAMEKVEPESVKYMSETFKMMQSYNNEVKETKDWPSSCQVLCLVAAVFILLSASFCKLNLSGVRTQQGHNIYWDQR